ncbi:MAG: hypothetical protein COT15_02955 [Candidatus Diapherotrites archaeon CG08_land_8_20_14_0_20_34_12]|nr:MAG: hypothetical protein COT15_02955 [Candidatus Diapherotrites archaeon CG08_land_8_20_14_0_20_34_12]
MNIKEFFTTKRILFILMFAVLAFIGDRINYSQLLGMDKQYFTFFQFFGPLPAAFLGPFVGILAIAIAQIANFILLGKAFEIVNIIRLAPMLFAAYYFGTTSKNKISAIIPVISMAAFMLHPVGQQAWIFSLMWLVPLFAKFSNRLFLKSLGTTFTAHAIGSALWIWTIPSTPEFWILLIPIALAERIAFALGITVSYVGINTILNRFGTFAKAVELNIDRRYVLSKNLLLGIKL